MSTATKPTAVENITVLQVGQYGVRVDEKTWFGVNEPLTPAHFVPNEGYKVSVTVSKTGKKYINEILGQEEKAPVPITHRTSAAPVASKAEAVSVVTAKSTNPTRAGFGQPLTDYDLAIQRQISRAGLYQAALNSPALAQWSVNVDEYLALVAKAADAGLSYVTR